MKGKKKSCVAVGLVIFLYWSFTKHTHFIVLNTADNDACMTLSHQSNQRKHKTMQ